MDKNLKQDILQWDTVNWAVPFEYWENILNGDKKRLNCLELGCREGGLSLWLALKGYQVIASDLRDTQTTASPLHQRYQMETQITYQDVNALSIPFENYFDIIVFKSILGGIGRNSNLENQRQVINQIYKALKPGGRLLFAENGRATILHEFFRKNFTKWGQTWRYVSVQEMNDFLIPFSKFTIKTTGFSGVFGRSEKQKIFFGRADKYFFNKITPKTWKYIIYGEAVK